MPAINVEEQKKQINEAGVAALRIAENVRPELSAQEQALFVAGFQECIKYQNLSAPKLNVEEQAINYADTAERSTSYYENIKNAVIYGASLKTKSVIPVDAYGLEVFDIKESENGKEAYIGFKVSNGNFHFVQVPFTQPKLNVEEAAEAKIQAMVKEAYYDGFNQSNYSFLHPDVVPVKECQSAGEEYLESKKGQIKNILSLQQSSK